MKLNTLLLFAFILLLLVSGCKERPSNNQKIFKDTSKIVQDNTVFAVDLYQQFCSLEGNLFFSPYSISSALAITYVGARGETEQQMAQALHFTIAQDNLHPEFAKLQAGLNKIQQTGNVKLNIVNSLWFQQGYPLKEEYLSLTKKYYGATISPVDFIDAPSAATEKINRWVEDKTQGKIKDIVGSLLPDMRMLLVNAVYFKGDWEHKFYPGYTKNSTFHLTDDKSIQTPMMNKTMKTMYAETRDIQVLELPYIGENLSMLVLLPKEIEGLKKLENSLFVKNLESWRNKLEQKQVDIFLPKFEMTCTYDIIPAFMKMGMVDAFALGTSDFSGMIGTNDLFISSIIHKAFVEVNEEGTEATAVTAVGIPVAGRGISLPKIFTFRADHPFLFLIQDKQTGSILFIGRLSDPTKTDS